MTDLWLRSDFVLNHTFAQGVQANGLPGIFVHSFCCVFVLAFHNGIFLCRSRGPIDSVLQVTSEEASVWGGIGMLFCMLGSTHVWLFSDVAAGASLKHNKSISSFSVSDHGPTRRCLMLPRVLLVCSSGGQTAFGPTRASQGPR